MPDVISAALAYWEKKRGARVMPGRHDLDPVDIPKLLPFVMLVDVLERPLDFRFRLIGTKVRQIIKSDYTGMTFSELPHMKAGNPVWAAYEEVVASALPSVSAINYVGNESSVRSLRHALMPLSSDGQTVNMIFAAVEIERG